MKNEFAEALVDKKFKVLDNGFIILKDYMGTDSCIVNAARVSYGKGTKAVRDDSNLINYLIQHGHTSPFEMCELKFHMSMPIFVAREFIRHRTANVNEYSARYSEVPSLYYCPTQQRIRKQDKKNKQASGNELVFDDETYVQYDKHRKSLNDDVFEHYEAQLEMGVSREIARIDLPLSTYTYWYWKCDLRNIFHFLNLRLRPNAQEEIRKYAEVMAFIVRSAYPLAFSAFEKYVLNTVSIPIDSIYPDMIIDYSHFQKTGERISLKLPEKIVIGEYYAQDTDEKME